MRSTMHSIAVTVAATALAWLAGACASGGSGSSDGAEITERWQQPQAKSGEPAKRYANVYVIGIAHSDELRRAFEEEFVKQLQGQGVRAIASYNTLPQTGASREEVVRVVRASGADGVVITRLLKREQRHKAAFGPEGYHTHYSSATTSVYAPRPPVVYRTEVVTLETRLFDAAREELVWAATTELFDPRATEAQVARLVRALVKDIKKGALI